MTRARSAVLLLAALFLGSCAALREPVAPMRSVTYPADGEARALIVLLPGRRSMPEDFARQGFVEALRRARADADVVAVDAHLGYYRQETLDVRLWEDVLAPATARYEEIWLLGVSLGGIGSLGVVARYEDAVTGAVLLAPYLGPKELIAEIERAGGPADWQASDPDDAIQEFWTWARDREDATGKPRLYVGFGAQDRLAPGSRQMAKLLPASHVVEVPGGHDWDTWSRLLDAFLERGIFGD